MSERTLDRRIHPIRDDLAAADLRGRVLAPRYVVSRRHLMVSGVGSIQSEPDAHSMMISQLLFGAQFNVYARDGDWCWGQACDDSYVDYVASANLVSAEADLPTHYVHRPRSFVYSEPDIKLRPLMAVPMRSALRVRATTGAFSEIDYVGARCDSGFVFTGHITPMGVHIADYIETARAFLHTPYLWGGCTNSGIDCSGLVQQALRLAGYSCPRDSDMQQEWVSREIDFAARATGDLVFWPRHVGILTTTDTLLHANATHMLVIEEELARVCGRIGNPHCLKRP